MRLFFPGVQHTGYARSLAVGIGVVLPLHGWESSPYGWRADPFTGQRSFHTGVDLAAPEGSPDQVGDRRGGHRGGVRWHAR